MALLAATVVGLLLVDRVLLTPYWNRKEKLETEKNLLLDRWRQLQKLRSREKEFATEWNALIKSGFNADEASAAVTVLSAVRDWAQSSTLSLASLKPERGRPQGALKEVSFQISGSGPMKSITAFLWHLENASFPLRITELRLASRNEGSDDLSLQVRVTTLCQAPSVKQSPLPPVKKVEAEE